MTGRLRVGLSQRRVQVILVLVGVLLVAAVILPRLPRPIAEVGTLDECLWGWPVVVLEGEDWKGALPDSLRAYARHQMPIAAWPSGMRYDEAAGTLLDARGDAVFHKGDRVRIKGSVVEVHGDPSPCFYTLGVNIDEIASP
ncbi:MAG TPA: hypothetical protein VK194_10905 [Candidatus Deferrimicrobium sp.]|nr:hypothetical protein [Candidatus Deferrimicrobium sp.]